ncbi:LacI family DNA-binding transcriptional regulator [Nesterenkonia alba]|uniref:LacI family DNA-binding transcriptional regulator n=1 Tax=Nesterenkonia alba TaxID=515814 RepID=UPI0003B323B1|nr:LacI family DNA-binding transcriptional regulator [Nesterenkonia alba]
MRESVQARQQRILGVIDHHGEVKTADLAELTGVSMVTVRRDLDALARRGEVLRQHGRVRRSSDNQGVAGGNLGTVAIVVPERHAYLAEVTQGARKQLERAGFRVVLSLTPHDRAAEREVIEQITAEKTDGLLLAPRWQTAEDEDRDTEILAGLSVPTVLMERHPGSSGRLHHVDSVSSDHTHGVHLAVDHLVEQGHRRIVLASREDSPTARRVHEAFIRIAETDSRIEHWRSVLSSSEATASATRSTEAASRDNGWFPQLLREGEFTAALIHSDENALVLTQRMAWAGMSVPGDCAVVAYDDTVAGLGSVPLTAVAPPKAAVGSTAADLLCQRLRAEQQGETWVPRRVELLPSLAVRDSTRSR